MRIKPELVVLVYMVFSAYGQTCQKCSLLRIRGLLSADCYKKELREMPRCLSKKIQILDLTFNRISEITKADLDNYGSLNILYLTDNTITSIEEESFDYQTDLQTLDVSSNPFRHIPPAIFRLPSLQKLYMNNIKLPNMAAEIEAAVPIDSPLEYIDLSYNKLSRLPDLGTLPKLVAYNISGNFDVRIGLKHFAGLCKLQFLINDRFSGSFDDACECRNTEQWLKIRNVSFMSFNCKEADCSYSIPPKELEVYNNCRKKHEEEIYNTSRNKILIISGGVLGAVILLIVFIWCLRRRKKQKKKRSQRTQVITDNQDLI